MEASMLRLFRREERNALVIYLPGAATLGADLWVPKDLDISVFYGLCIGMCGWLRSRPHLWVATVLSVLLVFVDLSFGSPPLHAQNPWWLYVANRSFVVCALLVLAGTVHMWIGSSNALERNQ